jgi:hypothetical protein
VLFWQGVCLQGTCLFSPKGACSKTRLVLDKLLEKPAKSPVCPLNPEKLFQKLKFWNSLKDIYIMPFLICKA